ncbi:MAG: NAD kinase [Bacteroidota bacterium]
MKIAVYGKIFDSSFHDAVRLIFSTFENNRVEVILYEPFYKFIRKEMDFNPSHLALFSDHTGITMDTDFIISIGGDGTFLETVTFVRDKEIPLMGINSGRLGFLASISADELKKAFDMFFKNRFTVEARSLIRVESENGYFGDFPFALNDLTIHKNDSTSMITVHAYMNDVPLNSYWADGLIVSTPTGSTAYSLSAGGPIVVPNSNNFLITPLAPHNLTVRPIVVSDDNEISLKVECRSSNYLASLDCRSELMEPSAVLKIRKAGFQVKIVRLNNQDYFATLRNKLMWGIDKRN